MLDSHLTSHSSALSACPTKAFFSVLNGWVVYCFWSETPHLRLSVSRCSTVCLFTPELMCWWKRNREEITCDTLPKELRTLREARPSPSYLFLLTAFLTPLFKPSLFIVFYFYILLAALLHKKSSICSHCHRFCLVFIISTIFRNKCINFQYCSKFEINCVLY